MFFELHLNPDTIWFTRERDRQTIVRDLSRLNKKHFQSRQKDQEKVYHVLKHKQKNDETESNLRSYAQSTVHPTNLRQIKDFAKKGLYG